MKHLSRPVPTKPLYRILNIAGVLLLAGVFLRLFFSWETLPDQIPSHYNAAGEADAWKGKNFAFIIPGSGVLAWLLLAVIERFPALWNTGVTLTEQNAARVLLAIKGMLTSLKFTIAASFSYIGFCTIEGRNLGVWLLPVFLAALLGPIAYFMWKIYRDPS